MYPEQMWESYATLDGGSSIDLNVNGASEAKNFDITATDDKYVTRVNFVLVDGAIAPTKFGGISALTNGLLIKVLNASGVTAFDLTSNQPVKTNWQLNVLCGQETDLAESGGTDKAEFTWDLVTAFGEPMYLPVGYKIRITVQDDLTAITDFRVIAFGRT